MSRRYVVTHTYDYGNETYYFETERDLYAEFSELDDEGQEEYAREVMGIEYETVHNEVLSITAIDGVFFTKI